MMIITNSMFLMQVTYENWAFGEPNNYQNVEFCGELKGEPGMAWNDINCENLHNWICQIRKGMVTYSLLDLSVVAKSHYFSAFSMFWLSQAGRITN